MSASSKTSLGNPIQTLPGVADNRASQLAGLNIATVRDLLFHFPRAYEDRRSVTRLADVREDQIVTVLAEVISSRVVRLRSRMSMAEVRLRDDSGEMRAVWFGQEYLARTFKPGARAFFTGRAGKWNGVALRNPDYELLTGDEEDLLNAGRIVPVYRLTEGVSQRMLRRLVRTALDLATQPINDALPEAIRARHNLPEANDALRNVHFPDDLDLGKRARNRFAFEELLGIQLGVLRARAMRHEERKHNRHTVEGPRLRALQASLPFELTNAQARAIEQILSDMASPRPTMRLLQGDVGCGKTIVAMHAIAAAIDGGYQAAIMAPTEILAEQHAITMHERLAPLGVSIGLLTGSTTNAANLRQRIANGEVQLIAGTHALIQGSTQFHKLGLVVIDEQHRFGVVQRSALAEKGLDPEIVQMTATPIPRTLAITVYGGMDISVIDELPPNRTPVKTKQIPPAKIEGMYDYVRKQASQGLQTYIVCPLVDESNTRLLKAVTKHFDELVGGPLSGLRVGLMHGRLPSKEKDAVMRAFKAGELDVLLSTSVIEVGIDCPNATTMIIEDASQFGLTQLHQLRGRVGRGSETSHCFLLGKAKTEDGRTRLEKMCATSNGFEIAEADLALRGPGEFYGVRQSGLSDLRVADLILDARLLDLARREAEMLLRTDPQLKKPEHAELAAAARAFIAVDK